MEEISFTYIYVIIATPRIPEIFYIYQKQISSRAGSRVFLATWSRSRSRLKNKQELEPQPLVKKVRSRSHKKLAGSSALREDKMHKEIVLKLLF